VVQQDLPAATDVAEENADLTVIDLAEAAAVLALDATGVLPLFGKAGAIAGEDGGGVGPNFRDVPGQAIEQGAVLPGGRADEVLQDLATDAEEVSDGLAGLARQGGELALEDEAGVGALLLSLEEGEVALEKG
jgi:hypothetical protein